MKHTFNNTEFNIEGCQWWISPALNSVEYMVGCKHVLNSGSTALISKNYENQAEAETVLLEQLKRIRLTRERREIVVNDIFNHLRITREHRAKYQKYVNYWLDQALDMSIIIKRFAKDHPKWVQPKAPPERADSDRNPYYYVDTNAALQMQREEREERDRQAQTQRVSLGGYAALQRQRPPPWSIPEPTEPIMFGIDPAFVEQMANTTLAESDLVTQDDNNQYTLRPAQLEQSPTVAHDNELIRAQTGYVRDGLWFEVNPATLADIQEEDE